MTTIYVETSAWAKLVKQGPESANFTRFADDHLVAGGRFVSSALLVTEMQRLAHRFGLDGLAVADALSQVDIFLPQMSVYRAARRLAGANLRSLDALHLAHCLEIGADLLASYDERQKAIARELGIRTVSPGMGEQP